MRLISSGIVRSRLRSPASTCATANAPFRGDERARKRRVHVSDNEHEIGVMLGEILVERRHDACRLHGMRPGADAEMAVGCRQAKLVEESRRHLLVIVLSRVNEPARHTCRLAPPSAAEQSS